jgi:hypothetical protein
MKLDRQAHNGGRMVYSSLPILVCEYGTGKVWEWKHDQIGRTLNFATSPLCAVARDPRRILIADTCLVREVSWDGKQARQWELAEEVVACQPTGSHSFFAATRSEFSEFGDDFRLHYSFSVADRVLDATLLPDGSIIYFAYGGTLVTVSTAGKVLSRLPVGGRTAAINGLPNGNILLAQYDLNKVVELTPAGVACWSFRLESPSSAVRLPNGNTLIASKSLRELLEVDRTGEEVSRISLTGAIDWITLKPGNSE